MYQNEIISLFRDDLPDWVRENMMMECPFCQGLIVDNSPTGATTARWCGNKKCPGHMANKADRLAKKFGIKGFGVKTALSQIMSEHMDSHIEFMSKWFGDKKPLVRLSDVAVMAYIEGYGETQALQELNSYGSFYEYFTMCPNPNILLLNHREELERIEQYFSIQPPVSEKKMLVMATGSFKDYSSRDEFFRLINLAYGAYVNVIQTGKRKTGISFLIKEPDAPDRSKVATARECGIPIVTPREFVAILQYMYPYVDK